jgi:hypothetical protein
MSRMPQACDACDAFMDTVGGVSMRAGRAQVRAAEPMRSAEMGPSKPVSMATTTIAVDSTARVAPTTPMASPTAVTSPAAFCQRDSISKA